MGLRPRFGLRPEALGRTSGTAAKQKNLSGEA